MSEKPFPQPPEAESSNVPSHWLKEKARINALLGGLIVGLMSDLAHAQEPEAPQRETDKVMKEVEKTEKNPSKNFNLGPFAFDPSGTLLMNGGVGKSEGVTSRNTDIRMAEARFSMTTRPGVLKHGNIGALLAGGQYARSPYYIAKVFGQFGRFGFDAGHTYDFTSYLFQPPHIRYQDGAMSKPDVTYYAEAPLAPLYRPLLKLGVDVGPKKNEKMVQIFGGVRADKDLDNKWLPTGVVGLNFNSELSNTGLMGQLDGSGHFYAELYHHRVQYIKNTRWQMDAVMLANNYPNEEKEKNMALGSSVLNTLGFGKKIGGDMKQINPYLRFDWGNSERQNRFNASLGVAVTPFKALPDVRVTPELFLRTQVGNPSENTVRAGGLTLNLQVKI